MISSQSEPATPIAAAIPLLLTSVLLGLLIAAGVGWVLIAALIALASLPASYFLGRNFVDRRGGLLLFASITMLLANPVHQTTGVPIGYVQEALLFGLALGIAAHTWALSRLDGLLRAVIFIWLIYTMLSLLSTVLGRSSTIAAVWQLQYNLKWPLMFGIGCMLVWGTSPMRWLQYIVAGTWLVLAACVALEIVAPGTHQQVFGPQPDSHGNPFLGWGLRFRGPFLHSGYLAIISALLAATSLAFALAGGSRYWIFVSVIYTALVVFSGQRQELLALIITCFVFIVIHGWRYRYVLLAGAICLGMITLLSMAEFRYAPMTPAFEQWGIIDGIAPLSERAILSYKGLEVALEYFPLGSGLGTYGGAGAQKFDQSLFLELGFMRYWWFNKGLFLVDTFWPGIIAESGFLGAFFLLLVFVLLWIALLRKALTTRGTPLYPLCLAALASLTLMLANSPTSGALTDPRGAFPFWLLIGASWRARQQPAFDTSQHAQHAQQSQP